MFRKNLTIFMLVGILTTLTVTSTFLMNASAYKPEDPAAKYHCFASDANGNYNLTAEGDLIPCEIDSGDNAWMLTASALVLIMTPGGLAIFYGGLSRQKNAVNTLHMVFMTTGIIAIQWALWGYSLAFGPDAGGYGFIGTLDWAGLNDVLHDVPSIAYGGITGTTIPHQTYMVFQMMFAIITPALIVAS
ncbi:MAG: ammonium transporter, partial [Nitrososphaeraceae archaeon]